MSNNLRLEVLLKAVDQATRPLKSIQTASKTLSGDIRNTQKGLRDLNGQASKIDGFRKASAQLAVTGQALDKAKREAGELAVQFKNTTSPTRAQAQALEAAKRAATELQTKFNSLRTSVQRQRSELMQAGINTRTLSADERRLKTSISETTAQLNRQREALARVSAQQAKLSRVKERYKSGKELAGNMAAAGAAGVGIATAGTMAGVKLLIPGYDFAQKNSELQAVLGVDKQSPEMQALRQQARQLGDNSAASADDAAAAQIIVAKSGADKDGIVAQTPAILNMSLANKKTMEENAALLIGTKSAFGLADDKASHIADVISMAINKTQASFEGLNDSLTYVGPVAKDAGVTVFAVTGGAIVTALGAITWPIVAVGAAIVAGALLIRKYWEPISAFFSGVIEGIMSAFAPVGEMFAPLAPIFDGLGEKLRGVWQWFKDLIAPVKATQERLDSCKNVGVIFGQALADALMLPLNIFNKLRGGLDVILEKLGLVKKESSSIDKETAKVPPVGQGGGYIPTTSSLGGYRAYQPVTAPAGRTYIDQSSPTYQITLPGGGAPGGQLGNQLQDALEKYERDKRAKARASMMHD
ncbi:phage tail tape measure protein [Salmonella enterica]|nr:phage tail tape measure protein [Salmonella enterica]